MKPASLPQHIIAIAASAGGMEAIHTFFDHTPVDKVSYVVIQHLSPDHQSRLAELLDKHCQLTIQVAENGMPVETNRVYVIPNKEYLTIRNGKLYLSDKRDKASPHMTIDTFFVSLAAERGAKAIGIVLSGNGNDGSVGIEAIHQAGGWILVQDPATARFNPMPSNAIATGLVDGVLAPEAMPEAIDAYVKQALAARPTLSGQETSPKKSLPEAMDTGSEEVITEQEESMLVAIVNLIKSQLPFDFSDYKRATIFRQIQRRVAQHQLDHSEPYFTFLQAHPEELEALAKDFLISVTSFFRDKQAFETLERDIIPAIVDQAGEGSLKIWVAACATGQEAYSLAILVAEYLEDQHQQTGVSTPGVSTLEVKIFATDLDQAALVIASKGVYPASIAQEMLPRRLERFFTREGEGFKVKYDLRKMLVFAQHDLVKNPPYCHVDLITCRNLLIYLNPVLQKKIFEMLHFGLRQGGYLFLGLGENVQLLAPQFREVDKQWKIYQKTTHSRSFTFDTFSMPESGDRSTTVQAKPAMATTPGSAPLSQPLTESVGEALMSYFGQVGFCLDEEQRVVQAFGDLTPYLLPKVFNYNLLELLPETLSVAFSTAFNRALLSNEPVALGSIRNELAIGGTIQLVVNPLKAGTTGQKRLLVLLSSDTIPAIASPEVERFNPEEHTREHLANLEKELRVTKEQRQVALEKLESSTENLQSFNEELLSANEEMQSVNEELQSVNEELQTVNTKHQLKIKELSELNDDLNNYFRSNVSGQLFVDKDLLLKKFSPAAVQHINLRESDIGRPLHHLTTNIQFEHLAEDIHQVIHHGETITRELQATTGQWYQVMVMAYIRQSGQQPVGAMVTFYDITDLVLARRHMEESVVEIRLAREQLIKTNQELNRTNVDLDNFVYTASHDLQAPIRTMSGLLRMLFKRLEDQQDEKTKQLLTMVDTSLDKLLGVMGDMTEIAQVQKDGEGEQEPLPLEEILDDVLAELGEQLLESQARIHRHIETEHLVYARKHLRSILYNLLSNAIKYRSKERVPEVHLTFKLIEGKPVLVVADNGLGLKPEQIDKLFSLYKRFHKHVEGTGIGLYMIKRMVENNGGRIEVASQEGKGTTFTLYLEESTAKEAIASASTLPTGNGRQGGR